MSNPTAPSLMVAEEATSNETPPATQSLTSAAIHATLSATSAKIGLAWIIVVAVFAIIAPLVATSFPLLMKSHDHITCPVLHYLTPPDVILLLGSIAAIVLYFIRPLSFYQKTFWLAAIIVALIPLCYVFVRPPVIVDYEKFRDMQRAGEIQWAIHAPIPYSPMDAINDQADLSLQAPSAAHLMGTDVYQQDVASRMIHSCRVAVSVGFISTGIAVIIGIMFGGVMGYFAGAVDIFGMRFLEMFEAIPTILLLITIIAAFGHNLYIIMVVLGLTGWSGFARFTRAEFLRLRNQDFVQAAYASGLPLRSILFRHMLPNGISPVLVSVSFGIAGAILTESTLSFLGLGVVGDASWGEMLNQLEQNSGGTNFYWWLALYPGMAIFLTVLAYNLVGESMRDSLDPTIVKT